MDAIEYLLNSPLLLFTCIAILGLIVGSFLNVAIYRIPIMLFHEWHNQCREFIAEHPQQPDVNDKLNLFLPRSRCPHCQQQVPAWANIPLISYLLLRGKCHHCKTAISWRYPVIEVLAAVLAIACIAYFGVTWQGACAVIFCWYLVILTGIDIDQQLLPDSMTLSLLWLGLLVNMFDLFCNLNHAVIGAIAGYMSLWIVAKSFYLITKREGMGHGDFKLFAALGAWLGWQLLPFIIIFASLVGAIVGIGLMMLKKYGKQHAIPFGPYLAAAGFIALFWGHDITQSYLHTLMGY